ncbi:MAG TPA: nucleoside deaminase [Bacillota bacterium]|nr:nucleoside deaminase [Bacillota bacterium]
MDEFMRRAVQLAVDNVKNGGEPFGAVLVKDGEIVAEGINETHQTFDISGHAEMLAIRRAQESLKTLDLSGYVMYASGEPCPMCLGAMYMSGITEGYYCASIEDAKEYGLGGSVIIYDNFKKSREDRDLVMKQMPIEAGQENPLEQYVNRNG